MDGSATPSIILTLLRDMEEKDNNNVALEKLYSGVAAAAYTGTLIVRFDRS